MAISRRRSLRVVRIMVTMPSSAVATTMAETTFSTVSAVPTSPHSSCSAAPGRIADNGSALYSLIAYWAHIQAGDFPSAKSDQRIQGGAVVGDPAGSRATGAMGARRHG